MTRRSMCAARALLLAGLLAGCDATSDDEPNLNPGRDAAAPSCATGDPPEAVGCTFYYRESNEVLPGDDPDDPKFQFEEQLVRVEPDESGSETLGELTLDVSYQVPEEDVPAVSVAVSTGDVRLVSWLYQLGGGVQNQFVGDHGFTGLVYLTHPTEGGDYQLICKAE